MTKRWSSTASLDGKTKRQASKDARNEAKRLLTEEEERAVMEALRSSSEFVSTAIEGDAE